MPAWRNRIPWLVDLSGKYRSGLRWWEHNTSNYSFCPRLQGLTAVNSHTTVCCRFIVPASPACCLFRHHHPHAHTATPTSVTAKHRPCAIVTHALLMYGMHLRARIHLGTNNCIIFLTCGLAKRYLHNNTALLTLELFLVIFHYNNI